MQDCKRVVFFYFLFRRRMSSPIQSTMEVPHIMIVQSEMLSGVTLKNWPPTETMQIWPKKMAIAIKINPLHPLKWKAERPVSNERVLNMFQNCRKTNMVKKRLSS